MSYCHTLIRIPTAPRTPSMNLGQAVAVCLYELNRGEGARRAARERKPVEGADAEQMTRMLLDVLEKSGYTNRITAVSTEQKIRRWVQADASDPAGCSAAAGHPAAGALEVRG